MGKCISVCFLSPEGRPLKLVPDEMRQLKRSGASDLLYALRRTFVPGIQLRHAVARGGGCLLVCGSYISVCVFRNMRKPHITDI